MELQHADRFEPDECAGIDDRPDWHVSRFSETELRSTEVGDDRVAIGGAPSDVNGRAAARNWSIPRPSDDQNLSATEIFQAPVQPNS
jgi:hypothetical protein